MVRVTPTGIETTTGVHEFDVIVWATGFDFGTGALLRMGIRGRDGTGAGGLLGGRAADVPRRADAPASRTCSSPGARTRRRATTRATTATRSTSSPTCSCTRRDRGRDIIEVTERAEERWTNMVNRGASSPLSFGESSYYFGTNIPGQAQALPAQLRRTSEAVLRHRRRGRQRLRLVHLFSTRRPRTGRRQAADAAAWPAVSAVASHTVATGVTGEPTTPGMRSGGAVSRKRFRPCSRSHDASSCRYHISPSGTPELEEAEVVEGKEGVPARVAVLAEQPLDGVVVGHQRRDLRVGDPVEQRGVAGVEIGAHRVDLHRIGVALPLEHPGGETRCATAACRRARPPRRRRP